MAFPRLRPKDPDAKRDYGIDLRYEVPTGYAIQSATWTVPSGITEVGNATTGNVVKIRLGGGTLSTDYTISCHVVFTNGEEDDYSFTIRIESQ